MSVREPLNKERLRQIEAEWADTEGSYTGDQIRDLLAELSRVRAELAAKDEALARQRKFCPDCGGSIFPLAASPVSSPGEGQCLCGVEQVWVGGRTYPAVNPACPAHPAPVSSPGEDAA